MHPEPTSDRSFRTMGSSIARWLRQSRHMLVGHASRLGRPLLFALILLAGAVVTVLVLKRTSSAAGAFVAGALATALIALLVKQGYGSEWTGFGESVQVKDDTRAVRPAKTLWDWLQLLIIPAVLAAAGLWFTQQQQQQAQRDSTAQHQNDNAIALDQARETLLNTYIDRISDMLVQEQLRTTANPDVRVIARSRTLTALRRLDGTRRGLLLRFLAEAGLISTGSTGIDLTAADLGGASTSRIDLQHARLAGVNLRAARLDQANLRRADLREASLDEADLTGGQFTGADLSGGSLSHADLRRADLSGATLNGAVLAGADLRSATLSGAYLSGAILSHADLRGADLSNAYLRGTDLRGADLRGADLSGAYLQGVDHRGANAGGLLSGTLRYTHIFLLMMENHRYSSIIGNKDAPQINRLAQSYGLATNYYGVTHPSEPNYLATIGGSTFGIGDDQAYTSSGHTLAAPNLASQLEGRGLSWASYQESLPVPGYGGAVYPNSASPLYRVTDNPFMFFAHIQQDAREARRIVPFSRFGADLQRGGLANLVYIVPNLCDDMHGTPRTCPAAQLPGDALDQRLIGTGDRFVGRVVHMIMNAPSWSQGNSAIIITWDEDESEGPDTVAGCCDSARRAGGGHVPTIVVTNHGPRHARDATAYNHYSLLRTMQQAFGLGCLQYTCDRSNVKLLTPLFLVSQKLPW